MAIFKAHLVTPKGNANVTADSKAHLVMLLISRMESIGHGVLTGFVETTSKLRKELHGAPKFKGVSGPAWGESQGWRYEIARTRLHDE